MKEQIFRMTSIICCIGIIATMGGIEHNMLTWGRGLAQMAICFGGMVISHRVAEALRMAKRRKGARR